MKSEALFVQRRSSRLHGKKEDPPEVLSVISTPGMEERVEGAQF